MLKCLSRSDNLSPILGFCLFNGSHVNCLFVPRSRDALCYSVCLLTFFERKISGDCMTKRTKVNSGGCISVEQIYLRIKKHRIGYEPRLASSGPAMCCQGMWSYWLLLISWQEAPLRRTIATIPFLNFIIYFL